MGNTAWKLDIGASLRPGGLAEFRVWAPCTEAMAVRLSTGGRKREIPLEKDARGYFGGSVDGARDGDRYVLQLDGGPGLPDPASRFQPEGVHGPSAIVHPDAFTWTDSGWAGIPIEHYVIYELHVGTFTHEGSFAAVIPRLEALANLGVTAIELMPVGQFPGSRNWGYDGVYPYAPQNTYGGPAGLKRLVDACHGHGLAVILDVVYNHLGPEGNYLSKFGPYFTDRYRTPWGEAINLDGSYSDEVRHYFVNNACYWVAEYHVDGLRLDAIHGIFDFGANHFLKELGTAVHRLAADAGRRVYVIPESDLNDVRVIDPPEVGGYGLDAQWNDDFHHALHALLTQERNGYYQDFGRLEHLTAAYREGFVYTGQYSSYRKRKHGSSSKGRPATRFIVFSQNHDQVGNRLRGDRLSLLVPFDRLKVSSAVVLLSPFVPLLFMGEEYGEPAPFHYFVSHGDPALVTAVREGRRAEFRVFGWEEEIPDPQGETTFRASRIDWGLREMSGYHEVLRNYYGELILLRKTIPAVGRACNESLRIDMFDGERVMFVRGSSEDDMVVHVYCFDTPPQQVRLPFPAGAWTKVLDSSEERWMGNGSETPDVLTSGTEPLTLQLEGYGVLLFRRSRPSSSTEMPGV